MGVFAPFVLTAGSTIKGDTSTTTDGFVWTMQADGTAAFEANEGGDVSKVGTPVSEQVGVWTGDGTLAGYNGLKWQNSTEALKIVGHIGMSASYNLTIGAATILSDTAGTTTLGDIDAIDATTEATIEAAIDTLPNLTSAASLATVGTITTGVGSGTAIEGTAIASTGEAGGTKFLREDGDGTCSWQAVAAGGFPVDYTSALAGETPLRIEAHASQSAKLTEWDLNGGTGGTAAHVTAKGAICSGDGGAGNDWIAICNSVNDADVGAPNRGVYGGSTWMLMSQSQSVCTVAGSSFTVSQLLQLADASDNRILCTQDLVTQWQGYSPGAQARIARGVQIIGGIAGTGGSGDYDGGDITLSLGQNAGAGSAGGSALIIETSSLTTSGGGLSSLVTGVKVAPNSFSWHNYEEGGTANLARKTSHETHTLANAATSDTTTISIPSGARLLAVSFCVNTTVVDDGGDDTWSAAFITGSTTTLATAAAAAQNTKVDKMLTDEISTGVCEIRFTANGGSFTAGVIEIVAYSEELTSLADV